MDYNKLVFAGPVGAGKSTAIRAVSDVAPVMTEQPLSEGAMGDKTTTTVALDYSFINIDGEVMHLYGLPGQEQLGFMRDILLQGAYGVVLLLDASDDAINEQAKQWLDSLLGIARDIKLVVAVTKSENSLHFSLNALRDVVKQFVPTAPIITIDPRETQDVRQALQILVSL